VPHSMVVGGRLVLGSWAEVQQKEELDAFEGSQLLHKLDTTRHILIPALQKIVATLGQFDVRQSPLHLNLC
jgi:hypothetical protein